MPTLLVAVPLSKSWLGLHYWKAPPLMELPVELEYIPYQEFEDRFEKLNKIARPIYPTFWPNVIMILVFVGLAATAAIGMSQKGSALSIMGQGSCFILPVIVVLWIRIRKETKARSRKKFKHRSQKLLRAWTVQDTETHAIQWKLRLRPKAKSAARRWRGFSNSSTPNVTGLTEEENNLQDNNMDRLNNTTVGASANAYLSPNHPRLHQQTSPQNSQEGQEQQEQDHQTSESASQSPSVQITPPPRVADVYTALSNPTATTTTTSTALTTQPIVTIVATPTTAITDMVGEGDLEAGPTPPRSKWEPWKELLMELYCCAYLFKQSKVWMIEISLRENLLDEYALPVPSPVYCDYRLPGYDDVMSNLTPSTMIQSATSTNASTIVVTRQGTIPTTRYLGSPPAYESDSENDSDDEDGQDDDEGNDSEAESVHLPTSAPVTRGSQSEMSSVGSMSVAAGSIVHQPMEMTTVVVAPSSKGTRSGEDPSRDGGVEDPHEEVMRSMTSMTTLCASATTSRATLPVNPLATVDSEDKEAGSKERSDQS
ncbi:hypothetical protein CPC16_009357 [Podila verticillata]|nr:hypothetical protein CPC16_009357 [Podila verticillata]KAI9238246.1 MAG: hypothetical protein BYD32DRAFT_414133 [Podila humilis]